MALAQEAKKVAKRIKVEEEASQWSGIPVKQLLSNSFTEQLNCNQSLQQIAPLHSTKDHLPQDIITILKRLGKVENTPFDKLYYLAENCADHYYMSVIKTFIEIIKRTATDRQIVLVNIARALKYLEDFGQRQSQLFTVLEKYHLVPHSLENLQSQFSFLKEATSRNIENLQQAITVQQTGTANLCTYINNILPLITKLEDAILKLEQKLTTEQDTVQINAPDFDPDIDGLNIPRAHNNTVVVSVQEWLIHLNQNYLMPQISKKKILTGTHPTPHTIIWRNPMGMRISLGMFKIIQQNSTRSLQDTASIQKKFPN